MTDEEDLRNSVFKIIEPDGKNDNLRIIRRMIKEELFSLIHSTDGLTFSLYGISEMEKELLGKLLRRSKRYLSNDDPLLKQICSISKRIKIINEKNYPSPDTLWYAIVDDPSSGVALMLHSIRNVIYELAYKGGCEAFDQFNEASLFLLHKKLLKESDLESLLLLIDIGGQTSRSIEIETPDIDWLFEMKTIYTDLVLALFSLY